MLTPDREHAADEDLWVLKYHSAFIPCCELMFEQRRRGSIKRRGLMIMEQENREHG